MKKALVAILLALSMLATAACTATPGNPSSAPNASSPSSAGEGDNKGEAKTLSLWTTNKDKAIVDIMDEAVKNFEAETNVKVELTFLENDPYKTKLKTVMGSGEAPDIFHSWGGGWLEQFVDEGQVLDITDMVADFKDQLPESVWGLDTFDGKIYGIPNSLAGSALFYNKALFDRLNLTVPATWSELETVAAKLKENGIIPFALGNKSKWPGAINYIYLALRLGGGQVFQDALARNGAHGFDDPSYVKAGELTQKMVDDGWYPEGANGINYDTGGSRMLFYTEKAGMMAMTTGLIANCKNENMDFYNNNLDLAPFPSIEGGAGAADEVLCGNNAYSVSTSCKNPEDAVAFLKYFSTDIDLNTRLANEGGLLVAVKGVKVEDPKLQKAIDIQMNSSYMQNYYDQALPTELGQLSLDNMQALYGKSMTPEESAKSMEAKAKELLG